MDDLPQFFFAGSIAAIGVGMVAFDEILVSGFDLFRTRGFIKAERVEGPHRYRRIFRSRRSSALAYDSAFGRRRVDAKNLHLFFRRPLEIRFFLV